MESGRGRGSDRIGSEVKKAKYALIGLLLAGCARTPEKSKEPVDSVRAELKRRSLSAEELGVTLVEGPGGKSVRWREKLSPRAPVTVPMLPPQNDVSSQPRVSARLNGQEIVMSLDTGAAFTAVGVQDALKSNLKIADPKEFKNTFQGLGGTEESYYGLADSLEIGELKFQNVFSVVRLDHEVSEREKLDNILGLASLSKLNWFTINYPAHTITFCGDEPLPPVKNPVTIIPFDFVAMQMRTDIVIDNVYQVATIIDTGSDAPLMLPWRFVKEIGMLKRARAGKAGKYAGVGGVVETRTFNVEDIKLGNHHFKNVEVVAGPDDFPPTLGSDFLEEYLMTVEITRNRVYLANP